MYRLCRPSPLLSPLLSPLRLPRSPCPAWAALPPGPGPQRDATEPLKNAATEPSAENKKLNKSQQLKQIFKEYGAVGVSFHVGISLVSLGIFYLAVSRSAFVLETLFKKIFNPSCFLLPWVKLKSAPEVQTFQIPASQEEFLCCGLRLVNVAMRGLCLCLSWGHCGVRMYLQGWISTFHIPVKLQPDPTTD
uniref:Family with sequence similarity 210 member B n=1 Tax=Zonotrichia albicollis TaxID=44394 RepID=A0A8D2MPU6_ZONAL